MHVLLVGNLRFGVTTHINKILYQKALLETKIFVEGFREIIDKIRKRNRSEEDLMK